MSNALLAIVLFPALGALVNGVRSFWWPHTPKSRGITNPFHRDDFATGEQTKRNKTTVDRSVGWLAIFVRIDNGHGARATVAFRATFL